MYPLNQQKYDDNIKSIGLSMPMTVFHSTLHKLDIQYDSYDRSILPYL